MLILLASFSFILGLILFLILNLSSPKIFSSRAFSSPFECGFDPYHSSRMPFSLQFFMITVIFLIFDIEITILLPLPSTHNMNFPLNQFLISMTFIIILLLGTYYEWHKGALTWFN